MGKQEGKVCWKSPSNIALVKYWGKKGFQLPSNASISFTLDACHTTTQLQWKASDHFGVKVYLDQQEKPDFNPKVEKFFNHIAQEYPILMQYEFKLDTHNTFPHSSGIASSASGMSALALCVCSFLEEQGIKLHNFYQTASHLARIGSGSASRSVYGGIVAWGKHDQIDASSDEFATPLNEVHEVFNTYQDVILLVHEGQKSVSSTVGHQLLDNHIFAQERFQAAHQNIGELIEILKSGNLDKFVELVENEALMLHSLMMTSSPSFILMLPNTLAILQKIRDFRKQNACHIAFTLDAGANVHMLFPEKDRALAMSFIDTQLIEHCSNAQYICDNVGSGPQKLEC